MNELLEAMSIPELTKFKNQYKDNETITAIVDGYITQRKAEEERAKAKAEFETKVAEIIGNLPHPEDVHNVYLAWQKVEETDETAEAEAVEIVDPETHQKRTEMRKPTITTERWVVTLNKGFTVKGSGGSGQTANKRAITIKRIEANDTLTTVGNFPSAAKACEYLKINKGADSANRVLAREGYLVQPYTGTEYTAS